MASSTNAFTVRLYAGDAKTLLAFNLSKNKVKNLAGFTIKCQPGNKPAYYLINSLHFADPARHIQHATEPANSSLNAPYQMFHWVHVPGDFHQIGNVYHGTYTYTVTPRYFDADGEMLAIDLSLSVPQKIDVMPFVKNGVELGFTRGFVQSQAFVHHFGAKAIFKPKGNSMIFDTAQVIGKDSDGKDYSFDREYGWCGYTARVKIFSVIKEVLADKSLSLDVLAYDFNEPDIIKACLQLAAEGRIRIVLDNNPSLHFSKTKPKPEDKFPAAFKTAATNGAMIMLGMFDRYQHNKVLIVRKGKPGEGLVQKVLAGSTNFSITGMYVNSNHVVIFSDPEITGAYSAYFNEIVKDAVEEPAFLQSGISKKSFAFGANTNITFSPHANEFALTTLTKMADRIAVEKSSVLFAIMDTDPTVKGPVIPAILELHKQQAVFSYGISDSTSGISLYKPNTKNGVLVTGKPGTTLLPPPFDKEASIGIGHQVHHKFIVCGFNTDKAVVWFGSSNLAEGGEEENGDNLIEVRDQSMATVFAIEALALVDHFAFRDKYTVSQPKKSAAKSKSKTKSTAAKPTKDILLTTDDWCQKYFNEDDLHMEERLLLA